VELDDELARIRARKLAELQALAARPKGPDKPVVVTARSLDAFVREHPVAVVDCWAAWCGPCRMLEPVIEALAKELQGQVAFGKLNVDEEPAAAQRFNVASIPTLLVFRQGRLADEIVGALPAPALRARLGVAP
jgi:thioredoxin 1